MMSELRWTLLILGVVFIAVLAWWERRRPRQASGALERRTLRDSILDNPPRAVRDPPLTLPEVHARASLVSRELPVVEVAPETDAAAMAAPEPAAGATWPPVHEREADLRPAGVMHEVDETAARSLDQASDLEDAVAVGASADLDEASSMDQTTDVDEVIATAEAGAAGPAGERSEGELLTAMAPAADAENGATAPRGLLREVLPELPPAAPMRVEWPSEQERRILALRLVAPQTERFPGRSLRQALAAEGFLLGQFAIFHKPDDERRAVLSAASLTRPGTFDMETMDSQHYGGLSLFAVLPGPKSPPQAFDELVFAARNLNDRLHGVLQDEHGAPLTPARIAQLREQLRVGTAS